MKPGLDRTGPGTATSFETLTAEASSSAAAPEVDTAWRVTLVRHPDAARLGASAAITLPGSLTIGRRADWLGAGNLRDERISREHAKLDLASDGALTVEDCESHNGTFVGGERVNRRVLRDGDVVSVGRIALLVHRAPRSHVPSLSTGSWVAASAAMTTAMNDVARCARGAGTVAIVGEPGSGRSSLAARLHAASRRTGALVVLSPATVGDELVLPILFGNEEGAYPGATRARPGLLEEADGGTLVVDGLEAARPALATALAAFLDRGQVTRVGGSEARKVDVRVIAITTHAPGAAATSSENAPALAGHFAVSVVRVPPLRERKEDIPLLVARSVSQLGPQAEGAGSGAAADIDEPLLRALLSHDWPGNVRELLAVLASAHAEAAGEPLRLTPRIAAAIGAERELAREARRDGRPSVARSGAFFTDGDGKRVELGTRRALRNILARFAIAATTTDTPRLTVDDLFKAGWPGERATSSAAATRVYVALATLRREGLKELIQRDAAGYFLDGAGALDIVDA